MGQTSRHATHGTRLAVAETSCRNIRSDRSTSLGATSISKMEGGDYSTSLGGNGIGTS